MTEIRARNKTIHGKVEAPFGNRVGSWFLLVMGAATHDLAGMNRPFPTPNQPPNRVPERDLGFQTAWR